MISHCYLYYNRTGGALKSQICLDALPTVSMEDTVHDDQDNTSDPSASDMPTFPESIKVIVEDDIIGHYASIAYHESLKQLAHYLLLPINICPVKDPQTKVECRAPGPFECTVKSRGTAAVVEWVSLYLVSTFSLALLIFHVYYQKLCILLYDFSLLFFFSDVFLRPHCVEMGIPAKIKIRNAGWRFHVGHQYPLVRQQLRQNISAFQVHENGDCGQFILLQDSGLVLCGHSRTPEGVLE